MIDADVTLRLGTWQKRLRTEVVDHVITDPPYGPRTHKGQQHARKSRSAALLSDAGLPYASMTPELVRLFVDAWSPRCRQWFCVFTSHDLVCAYEDAFEANDRYTFAPVACVQRGSNVRLAGDGPSNWTTWLLVARPVGMKPLWGTLPGAYDAKPERRELLRRAGSKPLDLMRQIVRDYSRPGDWIADPFAGCATTLIAAAQLGRNAIGAECDREAYDLGKKRMRRDIRGTPLVTIEAQS